jgi:hypothetical protein
MATTGSSTGTSSSTAGSTPTTAATTATTTTAQSETTTIATTAVPETTTATQAETTATTTSGSVTAATYGLQPDCGTNDPSRFNICLDISSLSGQVEPWFEDVIRAKELWEQIINQDVNDPIPITSIQGDSRLIVATGLPTDISEIDDMYVAVTEVSSGGIDGPGGTWALAGPDIINSGLDVLTASMLIESPDIEPARNNNVLYVMTREKIYSFTVWFCCIFGLTICFLSHSIHTVIP